MSAFSTFIAFLASFFGTKNAEDLLTIAPYKNTGLFLVRVTSGDTVVEELLPRGFEEWPRLEIENQLRRIIVPKLKPAVLRAVRTGESRRVSEIDVARFEKSELRRVRRSHRGSIA